MSGIRLGCTGLVMATALMLAVCGARAQSAATAPVGKPLPLLAGLTPPHETKSHEAKHRLHGRAAHRSSEKTAARRTHGKFARRAGAARTRHVALKKHGRHVRAVAAAVPAAPASTPPTPAATIPAPVASAQTAPAPPAANVWPVAEAPAPVAAIADPPTPEPAAAIGEAEPSAIAVNGQMAPADAPGQVKAPDPEASQAATTGRPATAETVPQTVLAAPAHRDASPVGSASWIAQVLAAFGGAVAAGVVAWFLIGGGPVRTYG
jgi:hypothetical protein